MPCTTFSAVNQHYDVTCSSAQLNLVEVLPALLEAAGARNLDVFNRKLVVVRQLFTALNPETTTRSQRCEKPPHRSLSCII